MYTNLYWWFFLLEMKYFLFNIVAQFMEFDLDHSGDIGKFFTYIWLNSVTTRSKCEFVHKLHRQKGTKQVWTVVFILHQSYLCTSKSPKLHQMETVPFANLRIYDSLVVYSKPSPECLLYSRSCPRIFCYIVNVSP